MYRSHRCSVSSSGRHNGDGYRSLPCYWCQRHPQHCRVNFSSGEPTHPVAGTHVMPQHPRVVGECSVLLQRSLQWSVERLRRSTSICRIWWCRPQPAHVLTDPACQHSCPEATFFREKTGCHPQVCNGWCWSSWWRCCSILWGCWFSGARRCCRQSDDWCQPICRHPECCYDFDPERASWGAVRQLCHRWTENTNK